VHRDAGQRDPARDVRAVRHRGEGVDAGRAGKLPAGPAADQQIVVALQRLDLLVDEVEPQHPGHHRVERDQEREAQGTLEERGLVLGRLEHLAVEHPARNPDADHRRQPGAQVGEAGLVEGMARGQHPLPRFLEVADGRLCRVLETMVQVVVRVG